MKFNESGGTDQQQHGGNKAENRKPLTPGGTATPPTMLPGEPTRRGIGVTVPYERRSASLITAVC